MDGFSFDNNKLKVSEIKNNISFPSQYTNEKKQRQLQEQTINDLKQSIQTKLINLGFTENECKHIIH